MARTLEQVSADPDPDSSLPPPRVNQGEPQRNEIRLDKLLAFFVHVLAKEPPTLVFEVLGIGSWNVFKRNAVKNSYLPPKICLIERTLREAQPAVAEQLIERFRAMLAEAYRASLPGTLASIFRDVAKYQSAMNAAVDSRADPFLWAAEVLVHLVAPRRKFPASVGAGA